MIVDMGKERIFSFLVVKLWGYELKTRMDKPVSYQKNENRRKTERRGSLDGSWITYADFQSVSILNFFLGLSLKKKNSDNILPIITLPFFFFFFFFY